MEREKILKPIQGQVIDGVKVYTTKQVIELFGLKPSVFRQWMRLGYVEPFKPAKASGSNHYFSKEDLYTIAFFMTFKNLGLNRWIASEWSRWAKWEFIDGILEEKHYYIVFRGDPYYQKHKVYYEPYICKSEFPDIKENHAAVVVNLKNIMTDIDGVVD